MKTFWCVVAVQKGAEDGVPPLSVRYFTSKDAALSYMRHMRERAQLHLDEYEVRPKLWKEMDEDPVFAVVALLNNERYMKHVKRHQ